MADITIITIETYGPNEFTVRIGDRYVDKMNWDEMLGQIAELTHPRIYRGRYEMLTAEEWAAKERRIAAGPNDGEGIFP